MTVSHLPTLALDFAQTPHDIRNALILAIGVSLEKHSSEILLVNTRDLANMDTRDSLYDRVKLTEQRIQTMRESCGILVEITDPLDERYVQVFETHEDLHLRSVPVPLGVVACIYEARPNVTLDLAILCIKSGNVCVLKGGSQATHTNAYLRDLIQNILAEYGFSRDIIYGFSEKKEDLLVLLEAVGDIDVVIPRGGKGLIDFVRQHARVPVIETGVGVVHIYLDNTIKPQNFTKVCEIVLNAKISRPSVCNALDTLLVHQDTSPELLRMIFEALLHNAVIIGVLKKDRDFFPFSDQLTTLQEEGFGVEYLSLRCSIKKVKNITEALSHIQLYSSHHSECIITDDDALAHVFQKRVDSAVVYHNTSTRFSDGGCFGFGAEVGISTQKIHARGPMGCKALTTYKYLVESSYLIRK